MMNIVKMEARHVHAVAELEKTCFCDPWSENSVAYELKNPLSLWLVAEEKGEVVGYIGSQSVPPESDMMNVAIHPEHRRKGIAEGLILALCEQLQKAENTSLSLEVRASNMAAISLYDKLGFTRIGSRPNYYRNPKEDAVIMRKTL